MVHRRQPIMMGMGVAAVAWVTVAAGVARGQGFSLSGVSLPVYETKNYSIHTDLTEDALREVELRMSKMVEEYRARTRGFGSGGALKMPFYVFRNRKDYLATGVPAKSGGVFVGSALLVWAGERPDMRTWHTMQHEGFHQYAWTMIGRGLPPWLDEGLAEYFGEAVFTGDGFVAGVIPQWRLDRVQKEMKGGKFLSLKGMMELPLSEWNGDLKIANYDQAWAMVQFLAHGDQGKYQKAFGNFITAVGKGKPWRGVWREQFGGDIEGFERRWKEYWAGLGKNPTGALYGRAGVEIMTGFLARAYSQGQKFDSYEEFAKVVKEGRIRMAGEDWLPKTLGVDGVELAGQLGDWRVEVGKKGETPKVVLIMRDGTKVVGTFGVSGGRVKSVGAQIQ